MLFKANYKHDEYLSLPSEDAILETSIAPHHRDSQRVKWHRFCFVISYILVALFAAALGLAAGHFAAIAIFHDDYPRRYLSQRTFKPFYLDKLTNPNRASWEYTPSLAPKRHLHRSSISNHRTSLGSPHPPRQRLRHTPASRARKPRCRRISSNPLLTRHPHSVLPSP